MQQNSSSSLSLNILVSKYNFSLWSQCVHESIEKCILREVLSPIPGVDVLESDSDNELVDDSSVMGSVEFCRSL